MTVADSQVIRQGRRRIVWGVLILTILAMLLPAWGVLGQGQQQPVSVVLLLDSSFSMNDTDPNRLRDLAADYLVDFLAANGDTLGLNYRLGAAAFSDEVLPNSIPIDLVSVIDLATISELPPRGFTDFGPALEYALRELSPEQFGDRRRAVVIFTDGRPERGDQPIDDIAAYFDDDIKPLIDDMTEADIEVFVVGIGDAVEDRENWRRVLGEGHFVSIDDPRDLYRVYSEWFSNLIGLEAIGGAERLEDGRAETITIEPFVEQVVVTAIKDEPTVVVSLRQPDGTEVLLPQVQTGKSHAVFSVDDPPAGQWEVSVTGGGGIDYYVWQRQPALTLVGNLEEPWVGSRFVISAKELSDRLGEAGEALELKAYVERNGQVSSQVMERQSYGLFNATFPDDVITEPGDYLFTVTAAIDGVDVTNLIYEPLTRTFRPLPELAAVRINGELIDYSGRRFEFEQGEELTIEVEVSEADMLSEDTRLTIRLSDQEQIDLTDNPTTANPTNGNRTYTAIVDLDADQPAASLQVELEGRTIFGAEFDDDRTADLMPKPVPTVPPPTVEATEESTAIAEIPLTVTPNGSSEPNNILGTLDKRWLLILALIPMLIASRIGWRIVKARNSARREEDKREAERRQRLAEALKDIDDAQKRNDPIAALEAAKQFFKREDVEFDDVIKEFRQDSYEVLSQFAESYVQDETLDRLYKDLAELSGSLGEHQILHMPDFARLLVKKVWANKDQFIAIDGMYRLLQLGLPTEAFVSALAKEDPSRRSLLLGTLADTIKHPNPANFTLLKLQANSLDDEHKEGYSAVYNLLAVFYSSEAFSVSRDRFNDTVRLLDRHGPSILAKLFSEVSNDLFQNIAPNGQFQRPTNKSDWTKISQLLNEAEKTTNKPEYAHLPEAEFLRLRIVALKQIAEQEQRLFTKEARLPIENGTVLSEIRPSLDLFVSHELRATIVPPVWRTIQIPVILYHVGDTRVSAVQVLSSIREDSVPNSKPGPKQQPVIGKNESIRITLDFASDVDRPSTVSLKTSFDTEEIKPNKFPKGLASRESRPIHEEKGIQPSIKVGTPPRYRRRSELKSPYVPDTPLTKEQLDTLGLSLLLPEEIAKYVKANEFGPLLISLRGLRRTGKTTNLRAFCDLLTTEIRSEDFKSRSFSVIEFDLMDWLQRINFKDGQHDLEVPFWMGILHCLVDHLLGLNWEQEQDLLMQLQRLYQQLSKGEQGPVTVSKSLRTELAKYSSRSNSQVLFVFDEADLFSYFPPKEQDNIFKELAALSNDAGVPVIIAHDANDEQWSDGMISAFETAAEAERPTSRVPRSKYYREFHTTLMDEASMNALVTKGGLEFTDLALKTAWALTGGYETLVQALCNYLIVKRKAEKSEEEEPWVDVTVTADDVKDAVYDYSISFKSMLDYLGFSFEPAEYLLMLTIASYHINLDTGLLVDIRYEANSNHDIWHYTEIIYDDISHQYPDKVTSEEVQGLLTKLRKKQILQPVEVDGNTLSYVRWRVGWFIHYLRFSAQADLTALLSKIEPTEKSNASSYVTGD